MNLQEKHLISEVPKLTNTQLQDIKDHGYNAETYLNLVEKTDTKHYRIFVFGQIAKELIKRGLINIETEFDFWWEAWTGY